MFKNIKRRIKDRIQQLWRGVIPKLGSIPLKRLPSFPKGWNFYHTVAVYVVGFGLVGIISYSLYLVFWTFGVIFALGIIFIMLIKLRPPAPKRDG